MTGNQSSPSRTRRTPCSPIYGFFTFGKPLPHHHFAFLPLASWFFVLSPVRSSAKLEEDDDENAELSFASATSEAPDDPSPRDARRALKTLQSFAAKNLVGVAAMDALMKLEICITDAKLEPVLQFEQLLPE